MEPNPQQLSASAPFPSSSSHSLYRGRFAPSPSGLLHAGSLIAALASFLDAKANHGQWFVRMEDLDPPRESPEAATAILHSLEKLHLFWDGKVLYQSQRQNAYEQALESLMHAGLLFPCTCSRTQIQANGGVYPGTCRNQRFTSGSSPFALRCLTSQSTQQYNDLFQGQQSQKLNQVGDFVLKRKDGFYAYQLAVVIDDADQKISHIIRGNDLSSSTGRQIYLQEQLGLPTPRYGHIPVIVNEQGQKLSKQHFAEPINMQRPSQTLLSALDYLQQDPDSELRHCSPEDILAWAIANWRPAKLAGLTTLQLLR